MINDPIVNEIRRIRREYADEFNNDLHAICEELRRQERTGRPGHGDSSTRQNEATSEQPDADSTG